MGAPDPGLQRSKQQVKHFIFCRQMIYAYSGIYGLFDNESKRADHMIWFSQ